MTNVRFEMGNGVTEAQALESLQAVAAGKYSDLAVMAWDNERARWAKPEDLLKAFGFNVISWGDTGGHAYAITDCGLYLSSNGLHRKLASAEGKASEMRERGFEFASI